MKTIEMGNPAPNPRALYYFTVTKAMINTEIELATNSNTL